MLDAVVNFGKVTVSTTYDADDTSIALATGHGARLPQPSSAGAFNLVWWNVTDYPDPSDDPNVEIVRVTARSTDTLTVTRAQESTSGSTKSSAGKTYKMILAITKKMVDDIDAVLVPTGTIDDSNLDFVYTRKPRLVFINGTAYRENDGWTWTAGTLTATLFSPVGTGGKTFGI